ncbi:MAG: hypothetical protein ACE5FI_10345 [Anaerolineales bacterium]
MSGRATFFRIAAVILFTASGCAPAPESGTVLFQDDFSAADSGWPVQQDVEAATGYVDGEYEIAVQVPQLTVWSIFDASYDDVIVKVAARTAAGPEDNAFGVICRYQDDENFYFMLVSADGFYGIGAVVARETHFIQGAADVMDYSGDIPIGLVQNTITAACIGSELTLTINGVDLATASAPEFTSGKIGLIAKSFLEPGVEIRFDDLAVVQP